MNKQGSDQNDPPVDGLERSEKPSTGGASRDGGADGARSPDPEVSEKPVRRQFTAQYRLDILEEADRCTDSGQLGALLRREGLYSSLLSNWRRLRRKGVLGGLSPKTRGRKPKEKNPLSGDLRRLEKENERLKAQLTKAETSIHFQKKLSEMLGIIPSDPQNNGKD